MGAKRKAPAAVTPDKRTEKSEVAVTASKRRKAKDTKPTTDEIALLSADVDTYPDIVDDAVEFGFVVQKMTDLQQLCYRLLKDT